VGKGIRGAPRDALIADLSPSDIRGASFGLRQSLDTVGAFAGPLAAIGLMVLTADNFTNVFWIAVIPAFLALGLIVIGVDEPARKENAIPKPHLSWTDTKRFSAAFWAVVVVATVLTLARFSEAFLILRSHNVGVPIALVPIVLVVMNVVYALAAYPAGVLSDRLNRTGVLALGIAFLIVADIVLALGATIPLTMAGVVFWGLHMGFTQGLLAALVADTAPAKLRGTAFGVFNFSCGIAVLVASVVAGALWDAFGPAATFATGAIFSGVALVGLLTIRGR
jgi:MFS family permease